MPDRSAWLGQLAEWQDEYPYRYDQEPDGPLKPQYCVERLRALADDDTIVRVGRRASTRCTRRSTGSSSIRATGSTPAGSARWASPCPPRWAPRSASPDKRVVAIDGDGCFQMTAQELATSATEKIPFITAILNNGYLGMVRQWQELFFDERYSGV